jgi:hypothetical protein
MPRIAIEIVTDHFIARKLKNLAEEEGVEVNELINVYLKHCILKHKQVIAFEKSIRNKNNEVK